MTSNQALARRAIPDDNLAYPVMIEIDKKSSGSGFYLNTEKYVYFVTVYHVIYDKKNVLKGKIAELLSYPKDPNENRRYIFEIDLISMEKSGYIKSSKNNDTALIFIGEQVQKEGKSITQFVNGVKVRERAESSLIYVNIQSTKKFNEVMISNEILIFGYPTSIGIKKIPQIDYSRPLLRRGIVAGKNKKNKTIVLDCPVYGGNSGGPVLEIEYKSITNIQFRVIGIVRQFVPFAEIWENKTHHYSYGTISNSGYSIIASMDSVFDLLSEFEHTK